MPMPLIAYNKYKKILILGAIPVYYSLVFISGFSVFFPINANAVTCSPVTGGANAIIAADCDSLVLDSAGNVVVNSGVIVSGAARAVQNNTNSLSQSFINNGTISASFGGEGISLESGSSFTTLTNAGTMSLSINGIGIYIAFNSGNTLISNLINSGTISGGYGTTGISNSGGVISSILNSGFIIPGGYQSRGILNDNGGLINVLTNTGTISIVGFEAYGIENSLNIAQGLNIIGTLNNSQGAGNAAGALTYYGALPTNYNIIITSASSYGKLSGTSVTGSTNFGIYAGATITTKLYTGVLQGLTTSNVGSTRTGTYSGLNYTLALQSGSSSIWDLIFTGGSTADTQQSLVNTSKVLQGTFTLQNSVLANSFSYDCNVFGANNVCISAGGRNTQVQAANGLNNTSALLIAAYRPHPNYRIGAYADQNLSVSNPGGTVNLGNNTPLIGLFGAWNQRLDGTGIEVKVSAAYGQKNATISRQVVGTSEAGTGSSQLNSQGAQVTAKYGFGIMNNVIVSPYVGMRYTQNNMGGYTEGASSSVTAPLTYAALNTNATTALAGVGASYRFIPKATAFASAGVETDTNTSSGTYSATGITGLTSINFNANPVKTRPTATLGAYYDIEKNQRIGVTGIYRQEAYQAVSTTAVMATYTIGL